MKKIPQNDTTTNCKPSYCSSNPSQLINAFFLKCICPFTYSDSKIIVIYHFEYLVVLSLETELPFLL